MDNHFNPSQFRQGLSSQYRKPVQPATTTSPESEASELATTPAPHPSVDPTVIFDHLTAQSTTDVAYQRIEAHLNNFYTPARFSGLVSKIQQEFPGALSEGAASQVAAALIDSESVVSIAS